MKIKSFTRNFITIMSLGLLLISLTSCITPPLHSAALNGKIEEVQALLDEGANINKIDSQGLTPLLWASERYNEDVIKLLLENGADVNIARKDGFSPLFYSSMAGNIELVEKMVAMGADVNAITKPAGYHSLIEAAERGHAEIVKLLLENGADINHKTTANTSAIVQSGFGNLETVNILLEYGADIHYRTPSDGSILSLAAFAGNIDIVQLVLEMGFDIDQTPEGGFNILFSANGDGSKENQEILEVLLMRGVDPNSSNEFGVTALWRAIQQGYIENAKILIAYGADVHVINEDGANKYLHTAINNGELESAHLLLGSGVDDSYLDTAGIDRDWMSIRPGFTTLDEIIAKFGEPIKISQVGDNTAGIQALNLEWASNAFNSVVIDPALKIVIDVSLDSNLDVYFLMYDWYILDETSDFSELLGL